MKSRRVGRRPKSLESKPSTTDGRSEDYTIIEVSLFEGRSAEAKKRFDALVFERLERELGIAPVDVEITLTETPRENWAMRGRARDDLTLDYRIDVLARAPAHSASMKVQLPVWK